MKPTPADLIQFFDELLEWFEDMWPQGDMPAMYDNVAASRAKLLEITEAAGIPATGY